MPRQARLIIPGSPHHIVQRGNHQMDIFYRDADRLYFLGLVKKYSVDAMLDIITYCLMTNHVHFVAVPIRPDSLSKTLKLINMCYSQYLNRLHGKNGLNWQGRFFSAPMDDEYTYRAIQYVVLNPVRANIVNSPELYRWSSAAAHLGLIDDPVLTKNKDLREIATNATEEALSTAWNMDALDKFKKIMRMTYANMPVGSDKFVRLVEKNLRRKIQFRNKGRPIGFRFKAQIQERNKEKI